MIIFIKCEFLYYGLNTRLLQYSVWYVSEIYDYNAMASEIWILCGNVYVFQCFD